MVLQSYQTRRQLDPSDHPNLDNSIAWTTAILDCCETLPQDYPCFPTNDDHDGDKDNRVFGDNVDLRSLLFGSFPTHSLESELEENAILHPPVSGRTFNMTSIMSFEESKLSDIAIANRTALQTKYTKNGQKEKIVKLPQLTLRTVGQIFCFLHSSPKPSTVNPVAPLVDWLWKDIGRGSHDLSKCQIDTMSEDQEEKCNLSSEIIMSCPSSPASQWMLTPSFPISAGPPVCSYWEDYGHLTVDLSIKDPDSENHALQTSLTTFNFYH